MVKTKARRTGKVPATKDDTTHCLNDSPEDGDWIIVKKQIITILVPAAPLSKRSFTANQGPSDIHLMPLETASSHTQLPMETSSEHLSGNEPENTVLLAAPKEIQAARRARPARVDQRIELQNQHQASSISKSHKLLRLSNKSEAIQQQPRTLLAPRSCSSNLVVTSLNQGLRASNLERKLERAGGLRQWLTSLGLGQFVRIFQGKGLNSKYQLVNLTMQKLKDMGANAVGPRRKLIHAIDCVCQPYCFEAL